MLPCECGIARVTVHKALEVLALQLEHTCYVATEVAASGQTWMDGECAVGSVGRQALLMGRGECCFREYLWRSGVARGGQHVLALQHVCTPG